MKRELLQNVKVTPYTSEDVIDREGFLSAVLGVLVGKPTGTPTGIKVKVTFTESDEESGSYTPIADKKLVIDHTIDEGVLELETDAAGSQLVNIDLDMVGCKRYVKAKVEMVCTGDSSPSCTATCAFVLGDPEQMPI